MSDPSKNEIHIWQWPNVLSLDAGVIAMLWYTVFGISIHAPCSLPAALVLGLSVWLTYTADRLFDVSRRPIEQLLSTRHQFAKRHAATLWKIWWCVLIVNIWLAFTQLSSIQLRHGFILLTACLIYTLLNQKLSQRYFPKQACVAIIFAGGVIVFHPLTQLWLPAASLILLCLMNCRLISEREIEIDQALGERSRLLAGNLPNVLLLSTIVSIFLLQPNPITFGTTASAILYLAIRISNQHWPVELYRVVIDGILIVSPSALLILQFAIGY